MSQYDQAKDLPLGLMMQLGTDMTAMNTFANLSEAEKEKIINYIKDSLSGDDAKSRISEVMNTLTQHQGMF